MGTKITTVVMNAQEAEHQKHIDRGINVLGMMYENPLVYVTPPVEEEDLIDQTEAASTAQGKVKGGGVNSTVVRNKKSLILFTSLGKLILYANGLYRGDTECLALSGFDLSSDPVPHPIPEKPVIDRIEKGRLPISMKIFLVKKSGTHKKESFTYFVQVAEVGGETLVYKDVLQTKSMYKLLIPNCVKGKELSVRVSKSNSRGTSDWSSPVTFIPQ